MNRAQRIWLATILLAIGILLPFLAFQWRNSQPSAYDDRALYFFSSSSHDESSLSDEEIAQIMRGRDINQLSADELIQLYRGFQRRSGIYIRHQWGTAAFVWGGLLPLFLIAASGFILLGRPPQRR